MTPTVAPATRRPDGEATRGTGFGSRRSGPRCLRCRRRRPGGGRSIAVAVTALVLVAAGVGLGGGLETQDTDGGPSSSDASPLGPTPTRAPAITPATACGPAPAAADDTSLLLGPEGGVPVAGADERSAVPSVTIDFGALGVLLVADAACATSWEIYLNADQAGQDHPAWTWQNPGENLAYAAQNRWLLALPRGESQLLARLHFGPSVTVTREWRVVGLDFEVPDTVLTGPEGQQVVALPGCPLEIWVNGRYAESEDCLPGVPDGLAVLSTPALSIVRVDVPGWTITSWDGSCGRFISDAGGSYWDTGAGCSLGAYSVTRGESPPAAARFLVPPGARTLQLYITAGRDDVQFSGPLFARVTGE
jgi:hypothetical protein